MDSHRNRELEAGYRTPGQEARTQRPLTEAPEPNLVAWAVPLKQEVEPSLRHCAVDRQAQAQAAASARAWPDWDRPGQSWWRRGGRARQRLDHSLKEFVLPTRACQPSLRVVHKTSASDRPTATGRLHQQDRTCSGQTRRASYRPDWAPGLPQPCCRPVQVT